MHVLAGYQQSQQSYQPQIHKPRKKVKKEKVYVPIVIKKKKKKKSNVEPSIVLSAVFVVI